MAVRSRRGGASKTVAGMRLGDDVAIARGLKSSRSAQVSRTNSRRRPLRVLMRNCGATFRVRRCLPKARAEVEVVELLPRARASPVESQGERPRAKWKQNEELVRPSTTAAASTRLFCQVRGHCRRGATPRRPLVRNDGEARFVEGAGPGARAEPGRGVDARRPRDAAV